MAVKRRWPDEPAGGHDSSALYVGDLPDTWSAGDVQELHRTAGLGSGVLTEMKLLPKKLPGETVCAILRYTDGAIASRALAVLNGMPVETPSGQQKCLRARFADAQPQQKAPKATRTGDWGTGPQVAGAASGLGHTPSWQRGSGGPQIRAPVWGSGQPAAATGPQHSASVYLSEVPAEWTEPSLSAFHASLGLGSLVGAKFLPRKISGVTGSVMLRYASPGAALQAVQRLHGHPVTLSSGVVKYLLAKLADPLKGEPAEDRHEAIASVPSRSCPPSKAPPPGCDPTSLYLSDVPFDFTMDSISGLHWASGLDDPSSMKYLPQKLDGETCCVILRYEDAESARRAIQVLHSTPVKTQSGKQKFITARFASMKRTDGIEGVQDDGHMHFAALGSISSQPDRTEWAAPRRNIPAQPDYTEWAAPRRNVPSQPDYTERAAPRTGNDDDSALPSAYVSDLPGNISEDGIRQLLNEAGLDQAVLVCAKFLPRRIQVNSICAILRCADISGVMDIVNVLDGYQVQLPSGQTRHLIARVADPPKSAPRPSPPVAAASVWYQGFGAAADGPTDLYVSEVPVEWDEDSINSLQAEAGVNLATLASVKILARRHTSYPTGAAILRYVDHASAATAMDLLQGRPVTIPGGQRQLVLRFADPPKRSKG